MYLFFNCNFHCWSNINILTYLVFIKDLFKQAIVEGADPNRTPTVSVFYYIDVKHVQSICVVLKSLNNVFLTKSLSQRLSHNVFVISFSQSLSHNVIFTRFFLTSSFSQRNAHNVILTTSFSQRFSDNFILTTLS